MSCEDAYIADYGVVVKITQKSTSNEVVVKVATNPYFLTGPSVCDKLTFHTQKNVRYAIGDTIRFVK